MKKVEIKGKSVLIDGKEAIIFGGEFQYFRIPKNFWEKSLNYLKESGINLISFYIPWIWHEFEEGHFDFHGSTLPERDLSGFIRLCEKFEFCVLVRPGPYIYAEYQGFGIPEWLREKHPEILISYESGQKSAEIALNHPVFLKYVKKWYEAIFNLLGPYFKNDLIFGCQIDNETGLPQYGNAPYMSDFNPHSVELFRKYASNRYQTMENLNKGLGTVYKSFEEVAPPRRAKANRCQIRLYGEFIEDYIVDYLHTLKQMIQDLGIETFFYLNDPYLCHWPHHSIKKSRVAPVGYDTYPKFSTDEATLDLPFSLSYATEFFNAINKDQPTIGAEVGCGWFDTRVKVSPEATLQLSMVSLIRNTRILAYYILHDCIEHKGYPFLYQAPLDINGNPTPRYEVLKQVGLFLKEYSGYICNSTEVYSEIGLGIYIPHVRDMIKTNINYRGLVTDMNKALLHFNGASSMMGILAECGYNPAVNDLELMSQEEMNKFKVLFIFSTGHLDRDSYIKIKKYVEQGGTLITIGYPVKEYDTEELISDEVLYPAIPTVESNSYNFGIANLIINTGYDVVSHQRSRSKIEHKESLHLIDMMQPMAEAVRHISKMGTWVDKKRGGKLWASRYVSTWKQEHGITPLLTYNNMTVSYSVKHGKGKSIFIGTLLGIFYDSPCYYNEEEAKKESITDFISLILKEAGLKPLHSPCAGIEAIIRTMGEEMIIFLVNRGNRKPFKLKMDLKAYKNIKLIFKSKDSFLNEDSFYTHKSLKGIIEKDDIMGIHLF